MVMQEKFKEGEKGREGFCAKHLLGKKGRFELP